MPSPIRLALICDYLEERWASMDLVGEMVLSHLRARHAGAIAPTRVCPPFRHRAGRLAPARLARAAHNADRALNRMVDYPRVAGRLARRGDFDLFHLVDHSYSQVLHALPAGRAV